MHRTFATLLLLVLALPIAAPAQNPPAAPKPGPELRKYDYFVGTWTEEGEIKPGMMGPGGKFTGTDRVEWMEGGFFLIGHGEGTSSTGTDKGISFWGYDTERKVYTFSEFNSNGESITATGTVDGDTWTWTNESTMGGKVWKTRYIVKQLSPTSYTFKLDMQPEGGQWATAFEGKATKK